MIRCRTVRQLSAQERWDTEFVLSIKGTPWSPDGERAGDVSIRVDLPEARGDRGVHPPDIDPPIIPGECASPERCSRGLVSPPNAWVAVPVQELGTRQTTLSDVAKGLSRSSRKSLKELPGSLATQRELSVPGTRSEPET